MTTYFTIEKSATGIVFSGCVTYDDIQKAWSRMDPMDQQTVPANFKGGDPVLSLHVLELLFKGLKKHSRVQDTNESIENTLALIEVLLSTVVKSAKKEAPAGEDRGQGGETKETTTKNEPSV